ncbi:MAG: zinc finger domain-containing protein, partial [Polyangiaceae bacterium]
GPDILAPGFDAGEAASGLVARGERPIGEVVMDQTVIAGIGNIYKSESLYIARIDPFASTEALGVERVRTLLAHARRIMQRNLASGSSMRTTRIGAGGRLWVYKRSSEPCFTCGDRIRMLRQGMQKRSTYYCPTCQKVALAK